tara:strand:+ start:216 stop:641 length:426 start_codon:yes stop_codon:yes gene_type:complete
MRQTSQSENNLSEQLQEILSGIISTLDVYDVIDDGTNYSVINLKNDDILYEDINLRLVANVIAAGLNTGEELNESAVRKLLEYERRAVSKMVETGIYEELVKNAEDYDKEILYEIKLQEADLKCKKAMNNLLLSAQTIINQ